MNYTDGDAVQEYQEFSKNVYWNGLIGNGALRSAILLQNWRAVKRARASRRQSSIPPGSLKI